MSLLSEAPLEAATALPGSLVMVRFTGHTPCPTHCSGILPLFQAVGKVDRHDPRFGDHHVVVVFRTVLCPFTGVPWVDRFAPRELVDVEPYYAF